MFDSKVELIEKIRLGEDGLLELKEVRFGGDGERVASPARESIAQELAAFANSHGGVCVLGVEDASREIQDLDAGRLDAVERFVREICFDVIDPPLPVRIAKISLPRTDGSLGAVLRVDVPRSLFVHQAPGGYFHRIGSSKRPMKADHLARLFQQRSQARLVRFDEQVVPDAMLEDLDATLWERFRTNNTRDTRDGLLVKLGMAAEDGEGVLRPTVSGVLMGTLDPRKWLPNAFIQAVAYAGESSVPESSGRYQLDAKDITGPLDHQVADACRFVAKNMTISAVKKIGRMDRPAYEMTAIFEALVNAVAHRDYSMHGSKIRLRMFSNRLEICSPGSIPNSMTLESLAYRQAARNENLASLLAKCPVPPGIPCLDTNRAMLMDKRGEGVPIILELGSRDAEQPARYQLPDESELVLTIYSAKTEKMEESDE